MATKRFYFHLLFIFVLVSNFVISVEPAGVTIVQAARPAALFQQTE